MNSIIPPRWNIFESERDFDPGFFSGSPYRSPYFVYSTILLSVDLGVGALIGVAFWSLMSGTMKTVYLLSMIGLPIVWVRMIRDHRKMRAWCATAPRELADTYPVRMASHLMNFAQYYLYFLAFLLLVCFAGALKHQAKLAHQEGHQLKGSVGAANSSPTPRP